MYALPQEIEVWYIIPAIRKELAKQLIKKHSLPYSKTGKILGISKSAVSQYISNKRGNKFIIPPEIKEKVAISTEIIAKNPERAIYEIEKLLKLIKQNKSSCELCKRYNPEIIKFCNCNAVY